MFSTELLEIGEEYRTVATGHSDKIAHMLKIAGKKDVELAMTVQTISIIDEMPVKAYVFHLKGQTGDVEFLVREMIY